MLPVKMIKILMTNITLMTINTIVTMTNLIFEASRPRLEVSSVCLFDGLEANSIRSRLLLRHLAIKVGWVGSKLFSPLIC